MLKADVKKFLELASEEMVKVGRDIKFGFADTNDPETRWYDVRKDISRIVFMVSIASFLLFNNGWTQS